MVACVEIFKPCVLQLTPRYFVPRAPLVCWEMAFYEGLANMYEIHSQLIFWEPVSETSVLRSVQTQTVV